MAAPREFGRRRWPDASARPWASSSAPLGRPGAVFYALLALTALTGWAAWAQVGTWVVFAFVLSGWVLSLTLHEFAHAAVAYWGGDRSVVDKGYLTLDPRLYAEPGLSILLPLLFVIMGGIGLPGGAVWINRAALRGPRVQTLVSVAGPSANAVLAAICLVPVGAGVIPVDRHPVFVTALAFLGFLQVTAVVLNLLPIPGLDGYGAIEPHLSPQTRLRFAPVGRWGFLVLFLVLFYVDPVNEAFWDVVFTVTGWFGVDELYPSLGHDWFRFWREQVVPMPT